MSELIDRQAAIDAIMGEPTDAHYPSWYAERLEQLPSVEALDMAIKALEQQPCGDAISRQAAIDELDKGAWGVEWDKTLAKTMIEALPSVQPEIRYYGQFEIKRTGST